MACSAERTRFRRHAVAVNTDQQSARVQIVRVAGELDLNEVTRLRDQLARCRSDAAIRLDLSNVAFIDSAGLAALLELIETQRTAGQRASIIAMSRPVRTVLEILGMIETLTTDR